MAGASQLWRRDGGQQEIVELQRGVAVSIPLGAAFQFRASGPQPLDVVIATVPPWPGGNEAVAADGVWLATR